MLAEAHEILAGANDAWPRDLVGVGGTASNLIKVVPAALLDRTLTRRRLADIQEVPRRGAGRAGGRASSHQPRSSSPPAGRRGDRGCAA